MDRGEVLGVQTHALHWELRSWRQSARGSVYLANIVGCVAVDDRTAVVRYNEYDYTYADSGIPFNPIPTSSQAISCQIAVRHRDARALTARLSELIQDVTEHEAATEAERDALGRPLDNAELAAVQQLLGPVEREEGSDDSYSGCHEELGFYGDDECRPSWAHYYFPDIDSDSGSTTLCARCLRAAVAAGELPDGFSREPYDD